MLELPSVTLVCLDCEHHGLALAAIEQTMLRCHFADVIFLTDLALPIEELHVVQIAPATTREARLHLLVTQLPAHLRTAHALLIQWDAFVVNAAAWDDRFLDYDYIAPETTVHVDNRADNEGIALVSARLLEALSRAGNGGQTDLAAAVECLAPPTRDAGPEIRIAPQSLRERFAFGANPPAGQPFGFQGLYNVWMFFQPADLGAFLGMATPEILASRAALSLAANLRDLGRSDDARTVFAAILQAHPGDPRARSLAASASSNPPSLPAGGVAPPRANVGRNDPCPCGSGRKYKQCHGSVNANAANAASAASTGLPATAQRPAATAAESGFAADGGLAVLARRAQQALEGNDVAGAELLYRRILERRSDDPVAIEYLGVIASKARRHEEAERLLTRALELNPEAPEFHNNLGLLHHAQADMGRAATCYRRALQLAPDNAAAHNNLGLALYESGQLEAAIASFREAVRLSPGFAEAHWNLALALLRNSEFAEGFLEHEWRMQFPQHLASWARQKKYPEWRGEPLAGKRILVLTEQGLGDLIQFVRYAEQLVALGATVVVEAAPELIELMRTAPGVADVVPRFGPYPRCDFCIAVMSLPLRFGTLPATIPARDRYLRADPARIARWQQLLGARSRPRIGIAWAGNPEQARDRYRSTTLGQFAPLLAERGYEWLSLQKGPAAEQIAVLPPEVRPRDMGKDSETFADLAALVESLDLVITVCTSVVHVAGALGKPAVLLLDSEHDWRWPRTGSETRWYPSVRIVRQPARGDWAGAILQAVLEVRRLVPLAAGAAATTPGA